VAAGVTIGVLLVPQGLICATLAGVPAALAGAISDVSTMKSPRKVMALALLQGMF
jgi:hypothetical protein